MDALSEILRAVKLKGALYFNGEFSAPWSVRATGAAARHFRSEGEHIIVYHLLIEGQAQILFDSGEKISLTAGDLIMFPHGGPHTLSNGEAAESIDTETLLKDVVSQGLKSCRLGGQGELTRLVCGFMLCDARLGQVFLNGLPRLIVVNIHASASGAWLHDSIRFSVQHSGAERPGSDAVLAKLSEVLFVETLRSYIADLPPGQTGWLAAARDVEVSRALALLHQAPSRPWTVATLAQEAGVSRSVLAERFASLLGEPPMTYLTKWRLQIGADMLKSTAYSVAQVAAEAGYESEAAFNRAFKREFGHPPAKFRSLERTAQPQPVA